MKLIYRAIIPAAILLVWISGAFVTPLGSYPAPGGKLFLGSTRGNLMVAHIDRLDVGASVYKSKEYRDSHPLLHRLFWITPPLQKVSDWTILHIPFWILLPISLIPMIALLANRSERHSKRTEQAESLKP